MAPPDNFCPNPSPEPADAFVGAVIGLLFAIIVIGLAGAGLLWAVDVIVTEFFRLVAGA